MLARTARSPVVSSASRRCWQASRSLSRATLQRGLDASLLPAMRIASGSPAHAARTPRVLSGSADRRWRPTIVVSSAWDAPASRTLRPQNAAPARSASMVRLVTMTAAPPPPGSSGLTWAELCASSRTTSIFLSASRVR